MHQGKRYMGKCAVVVIVILAGVIGFLPPVQATHFRYGHLSWRNHETNRVQFTLTAVFRRDGYPGSGEDGFPIRGDIIAEQIGFTHLCFGDGACTYPLFFTVTAYDIEENWIMVVGGLKPGEETIEHFYIEEGTFVAFVENCCRILDLASPNAHINNPDGRYRIETHVINLKP